LEGVSDGLLALSLLELDHHDGLLFTIFSPAAKKSQVILRSRS